MRHLIRLCICNRFLQILLLLSLSQVIFAFSDTECFQLSARYGCDCFYNENLFKISCPLMTIQIRTDLETSEDYKQIECKLTNSEYSKNYKMDIGNCDYLEITDSQLSDEPLMHILNPLGIKNVKHLMIYYNELGVNFNLLTGLSGLEKLSITFNKLIDDFVQLPDGVFRNLHKLKELNLHGNRLHNLNKTVFEGIISLQKLDLSFNSIDHFDPAVFSLLPNLTEINLSENDLHKLTPHFFVNNTNTTILPKNGKMEISQHMFDWFEKLTKIDLSLNKLEHLPNGIFRNQHKLNELNLYGNKLRHLHKSVFQGATSLQKLNLSLNAIDRIDSDIFTQLPNLSEIDLSGNYLHEIWPQLFANNKNLTILHINNKMEFAQDNFYCRAKDFSDRPLNIWQQQEKEHDLPAEQLRNLSKIVFEGATSLQKLDLFLKSIIPGVYSELPNLRKIDSIGNNLHKLSSQLFAKNKNLAILHIYINSGIEWLPSAILSNLPHLQKVHIWCNYSPQAKNFYDSSLSFHYKELQNRRSLIYVSCAIAKIPGDLFTNSNKWTDISLANNELRSFPVNLFADQQNLYTLDLSYNKLESLECDLFNNTISLRRLTLECNQLTELPDDIFLSLDKLEYLSLSNNRLASLPDELFRETSNLFKLKLSYNQLTNISAKIFSPLIKLEELYLDNNHLMTIDSNAFNESLNIRYINMENNRIILKVPSNVLKSPFHFLLKLQILKLRNNAVEYICWDWKNAFPKLKEFDLSFNKITTLNYSCFQFDTNRLFVNISNNQVRTITGFELYENSSIESSQNFLNLNYNPLDCDCNLVSFLRYLREVSYPKINVITNHLFCKIADDIMLRIVRELKPEELLCSIKQPHCPLGCKCWKRTYDATLIVNCSYSNLNEVPELSLVQTFALETIELHVENNALLKLPTMSLLGYANVTKIYAARNNISHIDVNNLPTKLTHLDLSHNNLKRLDDDVIEFFNQSNWLTQIALAVNPWDCDCANRLIMLFVKRRSNLITDHKTIVCATPRICTMSDYLIDNNLCREDHHVLITLIICFSVFSLLIVVAVAFYYKNKTEIKIWMYRYPWLRRFVSEDEVDKNRYYDAFISYAHEDQEFVGRTLVPELERNGPIRYKLCVHVRDFTVGESILKQIVGAIDESKRTIFVLSNHFIQSAWACMEFRLAHKAALNEGRARIIVIVYGDIGDIDLLDPLLKAYLRMNTYLEWGDPWFWDRLRYAMPHSVNASPVESYQATTAV